MEIREILQEIDRQYQVLGPADMEEFFKKTLENFKAEHGANNLGYASLVNEFGAFYRNQSRYEEGEQLFLEATEILAELNGKNSPEYATALNNLAELYRLAGNRDKAEEILRRVIVIFRESVGEKHFLYASALNYLGHFCHEGGQAQEALELYEESLAIVSAMPENYALLATAYSNAAGALRSLKRYTEALKYLGEAKKLHEEKLGASGQHYSAVLNGIGSLWHTMGDFDKAAAFYAKVMELLLSLGSKKNRDYAIAASNYAACCEARGELDKAVHYAREARDSFAAVYGPDGPFAPGAQNYLSHLEKKAAQNNT
ncbi:MAG: tetratricopeptide repeat protein [Acidaminococcales bacterium]|jgi:tetratricopeptide (TPR) repeat protein|nr:tetratricopeptide repeat protein [Acidaminococcales bacterium]